ncbi:DUF2911 domain-containing protein [Pontibacter qinzhouensis]|uniref:DUF2911 domain-containing protein n=1 Tax=Pontibacter qinzhouensis TaxID=2603253 RepID=A0A5C8JNE0_9BACT|nr:DUF2911 domain-containing protein [Pontibacter qinzhouensis]TXK38134.1 DUF2911 domain-containing protein [Pontibacter qinzhouensis]
MKNNRLFHSLLMLVLCLLVSAGASAQNDKADRPSPPATATGKIGQATVTINYSSPAVKGRTLWGDKIPYGKVWRAGANEATTFEVDQDVTVEGKTLPAGKYSLYTIPGEDQWTVIFNKTADQWGTQYKEDQDALRVMAKPRKAAAMQERLVYDVKAPGFILRWENLELPVAVNAKK